MGSRKFLRLARAAAAGTLAVVLPITLSATVADAKSKKKNKNKCTITGTAGDDAIVVGSDPGYDSPNAENSVVIIESSEIEKICSLGGNDVVDVAGALFTIPAVGVYTHTGTSTIDTGPGNDEICADNGSVEKIDGGTGVDTATADINDPQSNLEASGAGLEAGC